MCPSRAGSGRGSSTRRVQRKPVPAPQLPGQSGYARQDARSTRKTRSRCRACPPRAALVSAPPPTATTTTEWGRGTDSSALRESRQAAPADSACDCLPPSPLNRNDQQAQPDRLLRRGSWGRALQISLCSSNRLGRSVRLSTDSTPGGTASPVRLSQMPRNPAVVAASASTSSWSPM
jgi:hypothetical protein